MLYTHKVVEYVKLFNYDETGFLRSSFFDDRFLIKVHLSLYEMHSLCMCVWVCVI